MTPHGYIGIDFGTTNSHFAYATVDEAKPRAESIVLGNRQSNATCVLWRKPAEAAEDIWLYGDEALEEWLMRTIEERMGFHFSVCFKPDLVGLQRARKDAWAYLHKAYLEMTEHRTPGNIGAEDGMPVVIGVPAEISEEHKRITGQVAQEAGFGAVECIPEPLGALAYHLAHGQIKDDEAHEGVIVVDFGGGTLDVALVDKDGVREPWGNPILGGRLLDDLFFQWVLEKNPKIDRRGFSEDDLVSGWCCGCRELKEHFSQHWKRHGLAADFSDFKGRVSLATGQLLGLLQGASLAEFKERARVYRPSDIARRYFKDVGGDVSALGSERPIDLFAMIREALSGNGKLDARKFSLIVLTGGSSSWPFMSPLAAEVFDVPAERIICSASPEVTIGQGLAIYNVIRYRHQTLRNRIVSEQTERRQALGKAIDKTLEGFAEDVAKAVSGQLIPKMRSAYIDWYRKGGRLIDVEEKIKAACKTFSAERIVAERSSRLQEDIKRTTLDFVRAWLKEHGVSVSDDRLDLVLARDRSTMAPSEWNTSEVMSQQIAESFTGILAGILGVIGGVVAGGGGVALIASGPIGWIIGAAIGVAAVLGMKGEIKEQIKTWPFKGFSLNVLHTFVAEKKLVEKLSAAEAAFNSSLTREILQDMEASKKQLINYLDESVEAVAKRLSMLGQISPQR